MNRLIIIGAGGHGKVAADIAAKIGYTDICFADDHAEQVVDNKKVADHHAIIPTRELQKCNLNELPKGELAILQLLSNPHAERFYPLQRMLCRRSPAQ